MARRADVVVNWRPIRSDVDPAWEERCCLYAYLHPDGREILYVGETYSDHVTIRTRWDARDKLEGFWPAIEAERGIMSHVVLCGIVSAGRTRVVQRVTAQLIYDVQTLLILFDQPWGNIASCQTRPCARPGLVVDCLGRCWPGRRRYVDPGCVMRR